MQIETPTRSDFSPEMGLAGRTRKPRRQTSTRNWNTSCPTSCRSQSTGRGFSLVFEQQEVAAQAAPPLVSAACAVAPAVMVARQSHCRISRMKVWSLLIAPIPDENR
jgi:hypothetical protein